MAMLDPKSFKTRTVIQTKKNPASQKSNNIAIDVGYSAVKMFSANTVACFPAYAKDVQRGTSDNAIAQVSKDLIVYRDDKSEYFVGQQAMEQARITDASASSHYVRNRYTKSDFIVLTRVAMALGHDGSKKPIKIMTGLPPAYLEEDAADIKSAFCGRHCFAIKVGNGSWKEFDFTVEEDNVSVMSQPLGTLFSITSDSQGGFIPDAKNYFASNLIIFDPGFGTLDLFAINKGIPDASKCVSRDDLGMKAVFEHTARLLNDKYGMTFAVHDILKALPKGELLVGDRKKHTQRPVGFDAELTAASEEICKNALTFLDNETNYLEDIGYLVITGGTGQAWHKPIQSAFSQSAIKVVMGNVTDTSLDMLFSNVRGYYMAMPRK